MPWRSLQRTKLPERLTKSFPHTGRSYRVIIQEGESMNFYNPKNRRLITGIIIGILIATMVLSTVLAAL